MDLKFRKLKPSEIDVRVGRVIKDRSKNPIGVSLLLYKDARCDMSILDETVGCLNWKREHSRDNSNCTVSIWDTDKACWVGKEDTGTESNTEAQKGLASDSFKRACVNWGIGRELYTAPDMTVWESGGGVSFRSGRCYDRFRVTNISYDEAGCIDGLVIVNEKDYKRVLVWMTEERRKAIKKDGGDAEKEES